MVHKVLSVVLLALLLGFSQGFAEVFEWVDDKGSLHFAEDLGAIPEKYRCKLEAKHEVILGSTKAEIIEMFKGWRRHIRFENNGSSNMIKFENEDLIAVVFFGSQGMAEGVAFLSMHVQDSKCKTSYVSEYRETLVSWATGGKMTKVEFDKGPSGYPREVYIGDVPH